MLYYIGTTKEVSMLEGHLPRQLIGEICRGIAVLDAEYGEDRDYFKEGGYSLIVETTKDLQQAKDRFDPNQHFCEWATRIGNTGFCSALYILGNEFTIMVYLPIAIVNKDILDNLED